MSRDIVAPQYRPSEALILHGLANLQRGAEVVGGQLYLTNQRLIFNSHKFNVQRGPTVVDLQEVEAARPCWTRLLGLIPLAPNSLELQLRDGLKLRFVLNNRKNWKTHLEQASAARKAALGDAAANLPGVTISDAWERLEAAISAALGSDGSRFGLPATEQEIAQAEQEIGVALPDELSASLLIHNGDAFNDAGPGTVESGGPFRHVEFLPLAAMINEWRTWKEQISQSGLDPCADEQVRSEWWNERWIPITVIGGSTSHHCVDLAPAKQGTPGQVIQIADDDEQRVFVARSLKTFLLKLAAEIEAGTYSNVDGALVHEEWM
jgi:cell wall assembly regulator SMI1